MEVTDEGRIRYKKKADNLRECWWAMSATFHRSMKAKLLLDAKGVQNFLPMKTVARQLKGRKVRVQVPAVSNLIFVRCTEWRIQELKAEIQYLQFLCNRNEGRLVRIVVPDEQMCHFMSVAGGADENVVYFNPEEIDFAKGDKVRIHGGVFDGVEGVFVKVKGKRNRMVVVTIPTITSVATLSFAPDMLEKL